MCVCVCAHGVCDVIVRHTQHATSACKPLQFNHPRAHLINITRCLLGEALAFWCTLVLSTPPLGHFTGSSCHEHALLTTRSLLQHARPRAALGPRTRHGAIQQWLGHLERCWPQRSMSLELCMLTWTLGRWMSGAGTCLWQHSGAVTCMS